MAIQLTATAYADFQAFSTKKALDAKDAHNIDGKATRIAYIVYSIEKEAITTEKLGYAPKSGTSEAELKAEMGNHEAMWKAFVGDLLKSGGPRFGVVDVFKTFADGHVEQRQALLRYSPDTASVKVKMVYSQAEGNFKGKTGASKVVQCNGPEDLTVANIVSQVWTK